MGLGEQKAEFLRHVPFGIIRAAVRSHAMRGESAVVYVHPWEMDTDQPRLRVSPLTRLRHYGGLARTRPRLDALLGEFSFTSIARRHEHALRAVRQNLAAPPATAMAMTTVARR